MLHAAGLAQDRGRGGARNLLCVPNPEDSARASSQDDGYTHYDATTLEEGKRQCKMALQRELGLPVNADVPMLGFIGRLDYQKVGRQCGYGGGTQPRAPACERDEGAGKGVDQAFGWLRYLLNCTLRSCPLVGCALAPPATYGIVKALYMLTLLE